MKNLGAIKITASIVLVSIAVFCIFRRMPECFASNKSAALAVAALTLSDGTYKLSNTEETKPTQNTNSKVEETTQSATKPNTVTANRNGEKDKTGYYDTFGNHDGEEIYDIIAEQLGANGVKCGAGYVKNNTGLDYDFDSALNSDMTFSVDSNGSAQVLIYHTHTSESYMDEDVDYFYESFYSRTQNNDYNVTAVGDAIADVLNKRGIKTMHDTTVHDSTYSGSYDRSAQTVESIMEHHTDIKVVIDIHRDAIGTETQKVKPVFTYDGKQGAQIMILSGCDTDGEMNFLTWENNLKFALKIQNKAEEMYPGITRPLNFGYFAYNEYICDGSLLIEIGTDANTIEEAEYSGELLGNVLYEVLKDGL